MTPPIIIVCIFIAFVFILYIVFTVQRLKEEEPKELKEPKEIYLYSEKEFLALLEFCESYFFTHEQWRFISSCRKKYEYIQNNYVLVNKELKLFYTKLCYELLSCLSEEDQKDINYGRLNK